MMGQTDPASLPLRDIHLPDAVSWWPLAPGWWIVMFAAIALLAFVMYLFRRYRQYHASIPYQASLELDRIKNQFTLNQDKSCLLKELSALLRRISISLYGREKVAALIGEDWLLFLDRYMPNNEFSEGKGRILMTGPYRAHTDYDSAELIHLVTNWLESVKQQGRLMT